MTESRIDLQSQVPSSSERALLCSALGLAAGPLDARAIAPQRWEFLHRYATRHAVLPALAVGLAEADLIRLAPAEIGVALADAPLENELQNRMLLRDLAAASDALQKAGIASIALKGAALLAQLPNVVRTRHTDDIDLWVQRADAVESIRVLEQSGWRVLPEPAPKPHILYDGSRRVSGPNLDHHMVHALESPTGTLLDLHWRPVTDRRADAWDDALSIAVKASVHGTTVAVRGLAELLVDLTSHVVIHHRSMPTYWGRHLLDVTALLGALLSPPARPSTAPDRAALRLTMAMLDQVRADPEGRRTPARFLVFPTTLVPAWRWLDAYDRVRKELRLGPRGLARALWPSRAFLRSHGRSRLQHLRAIVARARAEAT